MKIFISWSGNTSKKIAEVLREWIPGVIQAAKPYFSPDDITKGSRWSSEISKELELSRVGIICLTKDNHESPWILFEAGALSKVENTKVSPLLFGAGFEPTDIKGPLVQFQASKFSKDEIFKVIKMISAELKDNKLAQNILDDVFEMWWPKLESKIQTILSQISTETSNDSATRPERDILEEILEHTRQFTLEKSNKYLIKKEVSSSLELKMLINYFSRVSDEIVEFSPSEEMRKLAHYLLRMSNKMMYLLKENESVFNVNSFNRQLEIISSSEVQLMDFYRICASRGEISSDGDHNDTAQDEM